METRTIFVVKDFIDLSKITSKSKVEIDLKLDSLTEQSNKKYSYLLNQNLNACGCETGQLALNYTILFCLVVSIFYYINYGYISYQIRIFIGCIVILSAILGKLSGLYLAQLNIKTLKLEIEALSEV